MSEITTTLTGFSAATIEKKQAADAVQTGAQSTTGAADTPLMSATWISSTMSTRH